jgi:hypothetical protein
VSHLYIYAPVAQWIERWFPVPGAGVRFPSGVPLHNRLQEGRWPSFFV